MDISVIIPVYNVAHYIEQCIESICIQTCFAEGVEVELILVDDCGTDNSIPLARAILLAHKLKYSVIKHNKNRGLSAARNTGMEEATGRYVFFLDSDDCISVDCLSKLYAKAESTGADIVYGAYDTFGLVENTTAVSGKPYVMAWNKLCKRSFLQNKRIAFYEGLLHEDCPWSFEVECKASKIVSVDDVTYHYLIREGSLQTGENFDRHFEAYGIILKEYSRIITSLPESVRSGKIPFLETQKALYFTMTMERGSITQLRNLYDLIRTLGPKPPFSKADCHYYFPQELGLIWYKKFHKYHLCV